MTTDSHETAAAAADPLAAVELTASLTVADIDKSLAWYRDVFGFGVDRRHERGGVLFAVSLRAGAVSILLARDDGSRGGERAKGEGFSLMVTAAQDIDALAGRIRARGGTLTTEPGDTPWGGRMFRIQDPDGFRWTVASPR